MKHPATIQRITATGCEQLVLGDAGVFEWRGYVEGAAFVFADWLWDSECQAGAECREHAECVTRVMGGHPIRVAVTAMAENGKGKMENGKGDAAEVKAPQAVLTVKERVERNRMHQNRRSAPRTVISPEEVFERMEKRHEA